ncbi:MAG: hypothetical protein ACREVE_16060 [Gammaproteobacteria bacterium]
MARPGWKGHISFGLIKTPLTLCSAERRSDLHFRMLDSRNLATVRYQRVTDKPKAKPTINRLPRDASAAQAKARVFQIRAS